MTGCDGGVAVTEKSATGFVSEIFAMKASLAPPAFIPCRGEAVGKLVDAVYPVMYALLDESSAIGLVEVTVLAELSLPLPPRYVEYRNAEPVALSFATKASLPPPLVAWIGLTVGKFGDAVKPVR